MDKDNLTGLVLVSSLSSITSSIISHPLDVMKVRVQNTNHPNRFIPYMNNVFKQEGVGFLYKGVFASVFRNGTFVSSKMFTYNYLKKEYNPQTFATKFLFGMSAGAVGSLVGTPFDVVMVKMQQFPNKYRNIVSEIYSKEGLIGFWKGFNYTLCRGIIVTACQFSVYEQMKQELESRISNPLHIFTLSSVTSSIITSIVSNPVDLCKTRRVNGIAPNTIITIYKEEGLLHLWKGCTLNMSRQIPLNLLRFSCFEFFSKLLIR